MKTTEDSRRGYAVKALRNGYVICLLYSLLVLLNGSHLPTFLRISLLVCSVSALYYYYIDFPVKPKVEAIIRQIRGGVKHE